MKLVTLATGEKYFGKCQVCNSENAIVVGVRYWTNALLDENNGELSIHPDKLSLEENSGLIFEIMCLDCESVFIKKFSFKELVQLYFKSINKSLSDKNFMLVKGAFENMGTVFVKNPHLDIAN